MISNDTVSSDDQEMFPLLELPPRFHGGTMTFWVLNRRLVGLIAPEQPYVVISVTNPGIPPAVVRASPHQLGVLRIQFHDVGDRREPSPNEVAMSFADAERIVDFVAEHRSKAE